MTRASWTYQHSINAKSKTQRTKQGIYYGKVNHTARYVGPQMAVVRFDGNKRTSKVPHHELVFGMEDSV